MEHGDQSDELGKFMQSLQNVIAVLHVPCATKGAARAKTLFDLTAHRYDKHVSEKRIMELTRRLVEELSVQKRSLTDKKHTENSVAAKHLHNQIVRAIVSSWI